MEFLNEDYKGRRIRRGLGLAQSLDFIPLAFFLWGCMTDSS
jgi:hypothetical protein